MASNTTNRFSKPNLGILPPYSHDSLMKDCKMDCILHSIKNSINELYFSTARGQNKCNQKCALWSRGNTGLELVVSRPMLALENPVSWCSGLVNSSPPED